MDTALPGPNAPDTTPPTLSVPSEPLNTTPQTLSTPSEPLSAPPPEPPMDLNLLAEEVKQVLTEMLPLLSLDVKMTSAIDGNNVRIQMKCEDAATLIGRRGSTINELQFLANRIMQRRHKNVPRFFLDVDAGPKPPPQPPAVPAQPEPQEPRPERRVEPRREQPQQQPRPQPQQQRREPQREEPRPQPQQQQPRRDQWEESPQQKPVVRERPVPVAGDPFEERMKAAANKVRRWGDALDLGLMSAEERAAAQNYFARDREIEAVIVDTKSGPQIRLQSKQK